MEKIYQMTRNTHSLNWKTDIVLKDSHWNSSDIILTMYFRCFAYYSSFKFWKWLKSVVYIQTIIQISVKFIGNSVTYFEIKSFDMFISI